MGGRAALRLTREEALVALRALPGVGDRIAQRLLAEEGGPVAALDRVRRGGAGVPRSAREALIRDLEGWVEGARRQVAAAARAGIRVLGVDEAAYPSRLLRLADPPAVLWVRGRLELLERPSVALVGARRATQVGRRMATHFAAELGRRGITVVSGMARGIDAAAHRGALETEGGTVAVLGRGPDRPYPLLHADLFRAVAVRGLLVSEFGPGVPAAPHHFPRRNRVLAALSRAVVVVEAEARSGALLTVDHAVDVGVPVLAVPGSPAFASTEGSNRLIRDGAPPVLEVDDILLNLQPEAGGVASTEVRLRRSPPAHESSCEPEPPLVGPSLLPLEDPAACRVEALLGSEPRPVDHLLVETALPPSRVLAALTRLELAGRARRTAGGWARPGGGQGSS